MFIVISELAPCSVHLSYPEPLNSVEFNPHYIDFMYLPVLCIEILIVCAVVYGQLVTYFLCFLVEPSVIVNRTTTVLTLAHPLGGFPASSCSPIPPPSCPYSSPPPSLSAFSHLLCIHIS